MQSFGVKKPIEHKGEKIKNLLSQNMRYYPTLPNGQVDEWQALIKLQ